MRQKDQRGPLTWPTSLPFERGYANVGDDLRRTKVAGGKMLKELRKKSQIIEIEDGSCYGTALLIPQLARSLGWPRDLTGMAIRSYVFLVTCILVHTYMLTYIAKEEHVMDTLGGQMNLCDFAAVDANGDQGIGPSGTHITPDRVYSWTSWVSRIFARDTMRAAIHAVLPDKAHLDDDLVDPGEYGIESYACRLLCVFVFVMSVGPEVRLCVEMTKLLYHVPNENQDWISQDKDSELGVVVQARGMSIKWKLFYAITIMIPKCALVFGTVRCGVVFLMETAVIDDIIVNSVALGFLLTLDELVVQSVSSSDANELCKMCEPYICNPDADDANNEDNLIRSLYSEETSIWKSFIENMPWRLVWTVLATVGFVVDYYWGHCQLNDVGRWVSQAVYAPTNLRFNPLNAVFPRMFPLEEHESPYWEPTNI